MKSTTISFRLNEKERKKLEEMAKAVNMSFADYCRSKLFFNHDAFLKWNRLDRYSKVLADMQAQMDKVNNWFAEQYKEMERIRDHVKQGHELVPELRPVKAVRGS